MEKMEQRTIGIVGGNEGAETLLAPQDIALDQVGDGLAYRALADAEFPGKVGFARNGLAGLPFTPADFIDQQGFDLHVQRNGVLAGG